MFIFKRKNRTSRSALAPQRGSSKILGGEKANTVFTADDTLKHLQKNSQTLIIPIGTAKIDKFVLRGFTERINIIIPESVVEIHPYAFSARRIKSITVSENNKKYYSRDNCVIDREHNTLIIGCNSSIIPENVTKIGSFAFSDCDELYEATIPHGITEIQSNAFFMCKKLVHVDIPDSVVYIGNSVFEGCTMLKSIKLGTNIAGIGAYAFKHCRNLVGIDIPDSIIKMGSNPFLGAEKLRRTTYDNAHYMGNKDNPYLILTVAMMFPTCTVHPETKVICGGAFENTIIGEIVIPNKVTSIGAYTFCKCDVLRKVTIPISVTEIGNSAFARCSGLSDVYYEGTVDDWEKINIGEGNDDLLKATVHFGY